MYDMPGRLLQNFSNEKPARTEETKAQLHELIMRLANESETTRRLKAPVLQYLIQKVIQQADDEIVFISRDLYPGDPDYWPEEERK